MRDLTPAAPVFLYGYPHVPRPSEGVHDRLECAALYVRGGTGEALFISNDLIAVPRSLVDEVRRGIAARTGIVPENILISATHTHSGPVMTDHLSNGADPIVPKPDPAYLKSVGQQMTTAAQAAFDSAEPAEVGLTVAQAEGVGGNRHDPAGPADPAVPVMTVRLAANQRPIACMLVYGMHPTVLHEDSRLISADFPHFTRAYLRGAALPRDCPILFHNGASGNQSPRHFARADTFTEAKRLGENLGRAAAGAVRATRYQTEARVTVARARLKLTSRNFPTVKNAIAAERIARARYAELREGQAPRADVRTAECDVFGAEETVELARAAADGRLNAAIAQCSPAEIQGVQIGAWRFVGWPGEFFVEYGLQLKARAPDTFLITLANGELQGYIVTPAADARGVYEARNAVFAPANGANFVAATLKLLAGMTRAR